MDEKQSWTETLRYKLLFVLGLFFTPILFASTTIIGVAGASGAGKTTLAHKLKETLGSDVAIISQDSYYKDLSHLTIEERKRVNFDDPSSIDFDLLCSHLEALKGGKSIECPVYDFTVSSRTNRTITIAPKSVTILEGSLILAVKKARTMCDMKLFVDADMDICLCRRIERDQKERGRSFPDIKRQYLATVRPMFLKHIAPSKHYADLIIPNETNGKEVFSFISERLTPLLTYR